jgi:hypothetical protein
MMTFVRSAGAAGDARRVETAPGDAAALIRGYRREAGLTQRRLADAAGVSIGVVRISSSTARRVCRRIRRGG